MNPLRLDGLGRPLATALLFLVALIVSGCKTTPSEASPSETATVTLAKYGLPANYAAHDQNIDCTSHAIGYRFIAWITAEKVVVGFSTNPACRGVAEKHIDRGRTRMLVFDLNGALKAQRDVDYDADGGDEIVAQGEAFPGAGHTLIFRVEEAGTSKSGIRIFDEWLNEVGRIDRFIETPALLDRSIVFQEGVVWNGPRTYGIFAGKASTPVDRITQTWPVGTMDRKIGIHGTAYIQCQQEIKPGQYQSSNVVYAGANRRCVLNAVGADGESWSSPLEQNQVAEVLGMLDDGRVAGLVRDGRAAEQIVVWKKGEPARVLPWFPGGYETEIESAAEDMSRYEGYGAPAEGRLCAAVRLFCPRPEDRRLMIFDQTQPLPLVSRSFIESDRAAIAPDGRHYATLESGELRIYPLGNSTGGNR